MTFKIKKCTVCKTNFKPRSGVQKYCKECKKKAYLELGYKYEKTVKGKRTKRRYKISKSKRDSGYYKNAQLKHAYGITLLEYDQILESQNGVCVICGGINADGRRLHVDHNHKTGKVRGLLCSKCNHGLGLFNDDIETLLGAVAYLEKNKRKKSQ